MVNHDRSASCQLFLAMQYWFYGGSIILTAWGDDVYVWKLSDSCVFTYDGLSIINNYH